MPRNSRKRIKSKVNHIVVQGLNKEYIFNSENSVREYLKILKNKKTDNIKILSYCIMNNHAHLLIYSERIEDVSKFMQKVNSVFSIYYNKTNNRVGYVFKDRFYSQCIDSEEQLYRCINYIHNNPVKAGICKYASEYRYSSIRKFLTNQDILKLINNLCNLKKMELEENSSFIDIKDNSIEDYIIFFEKEYRLKISDLKYHKLLLEKFIKDSRKETDVSLRELASILNLSKSTVDRVWRIDRKAKS